MTLNPLLRRLKAVIVAVALTLATNYAISNVVENLSDSGIPSSPRPSTIAVDSGIPSSPRPSVN